MVADREPAVFRWLPGDPHPISYLRVRFGVHTCRHFYGAGPWDELEEAFIGNYPLQGRPTTELISAALSAFDPAVRAIYQCESRAFRGRSLCDLLPPDRVSPSALTTMAQHLGEALFNSSYWIWAECLRIVALTGLQLSESPEHAAIAISRQQDVMKRLGSLRQ